MIKIVGPLCKQLNILLDKDNINNDEFSSSELNTINSLRLSKRDLPYLEYFSNLDEIVLDLFPSVNNEDIIYIAKKFPNLKSLKIKEQNGLFILDLSLFEKLEKLCVIHNDNLIDLIGLKKVNNFTFYDNKDFSNIKQLVDYLIVNKDSIVILDIIYYMNVINIMYNLKENVDILKKFTWIESIGLRKYSNYEYSNIELDSLLKYVSFIASKYVYSTDTDIMKFCVLYNWVLNNMKFVNEDDPDGENLNLISNVNKVFSYGRGGRLTLAKAFQLLLSFVGIKSSVVYSLGATDVIGMYNGEKVCSLLGESDYAVLRVTLDDKDYYCDIAWDTLINFHGFFDQLRFFLLSKNELKARHKFVGEGNIENTYSYHGDDCDELISFAKNRCKDVDEMFEDIDRVKPDIEGIDLNVVLLKLNKHDLTEKINSLDIESDEYKKLMKELTEMENKMDEFSSELVRLENVREGVIKSYTNLLKERYFTLDQINDSEETIKDLNRKEDFLLVSTYMNELFKLVLK
jgi:hypothetical protein